MRLRREAGYFEICDPGADKPLRREGTHQCVHCGCHFEMVRGSGSIHGFCGRCNGFICGPRCIECVPLEQWLEIQEGTRNPTAVSVGGNLWLP